MDEMKIKSGLVFNKYTGTLISFVNLGSINHDLEWAVNGEEHDSTAPNLADQAFLFIVRTILSHLS